MNPFLVSRRGQVDFIHGFMETLGEVMSAELRPR
jgi:hypothetical protein